MGCSGSNVYFDFKHDNKKKHSNYINFEKSSSYYQAAENQSIELIKNESAKQFFSEIIQASGADYAKLIKGFFKENKKILHKEGIKDQEELEYTVLLYLSRNYLETNKEDSITSLNFFTYAVELINNKFLDVELDKKSKKSVVSVYEEFLSSLESTFPRKLKFYSLFIEKTYSDTKNFKGFIYEHFLFSKYFTVESLNIYLTPSFFSNEKVCRYFSEIVKKTNPLYFLSLLIYPIDKNKELVENFNLDSKMYGVLLDLIESACENESIKVLALSIKEHYKILIPPELSEKLLTLIRKDNLIGLYLGKFTFSKTFYTELFEDLSNLKNLKFLAINCYNSDKEFLKNLNNAVYTNTSLSVLLLSGTGFEDMYIEYEQLKYIITEKRSLNLVYSNANIKNVESESQEENVHGSYLKPLFS